MTITVSQLASEKQRRAADAGASVWVGANAGTGKTKVLTDRVLTLLLSGTAPNRLLCLTFTKAAAAEMAARLARKLSAWAVEPDETVVAALEELLGRPPQEGELPAARRLFAQVLDTPGGMRIETLHAFCQSLLRRFPLEAGVSPHFEVLEERDAQALLLEARETLFRQAQADPSGPLAQALALVTEQVHELRFPTLMGEVTAKRGPLRRLFDQPGGRPAAEAAVRQRLGLKPGDTPDSLLDHACGHSVLPDSTLKALADAFAAQGGKDEKTKFAPVLHAWTAAAHDLPQRRALWPHLKRVFLTTQNAPRAESRFPTKAIRTTFPDLAGAIPSLTETLLRVEARLRAARVATATEALLRLAEALLDTFAEAKAQRGTMDFDDLILATRRLLDRSDAAAWVLYKLDGGLDHILIDEAQDTSPDQWAVVRALAEEFFSGSGAERRQQAEPRTVFAVGDRKQSIYSFQGADPDAFEAMRHWFGERVQAAGQRWESVELDVSFRSTRPVLELVDRLFQVPAAADGVLNAGESIHHLIHRAGQAGLVELWPPVAVDALDSPPAWKPPVERIGGAAASTRLARLIAARIRALLDDGERLDSRGRAIRPGDILVLVRRRGGFVEDLVRALKEREVPVAGVDRMVLTDQLAVMDLLALGEALILPEDDLTLACVLKSPLIGLSEEALYSLAQGRAPGVSLWQAVHQAAEHPGPAREAREALTHLLGRADFLPPHELYAEILGPLGGREKLLARLGPDAADPIEEFVSLTLAYDRSHPPSLQGFLHWVRSGAEDIKRDLEEGGSAVRVMTVHGSKGLQAPVVFLPDTRALPKQTDMLLWDTTTTPPLVVWSPRAADREDWCSALAETAKRNQEREYRRLLYVALTRAEDRLYVCGWETQKPAGEGCWYALVEQALGGYGEPVDCPVLARIDTEAALPTTAILRLKSDQTAPPLAPGATQLPEAAAAPLPPWITARPRPDPTPPRPLAPSRPVLENPPVRSPVSATAGEDALRFRRGRLVHRLLEHLPNAPAARRPALARAFLARPAWGLTPEQGEALAAETLAVLDHPDFAPLFGPGSRAEVLITGLVGPHVVSGQVDRLLVTEEQVTIIDFKTNRPPPRRAEDVPEAYLFQMAAYRAVLRRLYPTHAIACVLLWTDGPFLTPLPEERLEAVLTAWL